MFDQLEPGRHQGLIDGDACWAVLVVCRLRAAGERQACARAINCEEQEDRGLHLIVSHKGTVGLPPLFTLTGSRIKTCLVAQITGIAVSPDIIIIEFTAFDEHETMASVKTI